MFFEKDVTQSRRGCETDNIGPVLSSQIEINYVIQQPKANCLKNIDHMYSTHISTTIGTKLTVYKSQSTTTFS